MLSVLSQFPPDSLPCLLSDFCINFIWDFTGNMGAIKFIGNTRPPKFFLILEDITQQLLESKHILTLGQLFKIVPNLKQYVTSKFFPKKKIVTTSRPNLVIASMAIDLHMVVI